MACLLRLDEGWLRVATAQSARAARQRFAYANSFVEVQVPKSHRTFERPPEYSFIRRRPEKWREGNGAVVNQELTIDFAASAPRFKMIDAKSAVRNPVRVRCRTRTGGSRAFHRAWRCQCNWHRLIFWCGGRRLRLSSSGRTAPVWRDATLRCCASPSARCSGSLLTILLPANSSWISRQHEPKHASREYSIAMPEVRKHDPDHGVRTQKLR